MSAIRHYSRFFRSMLNNAGGAKNGPRKINGQVLVLARNNSGGANFRSTQLASANPRKTGSDDQSLQPTQRWWSDWNKVRASKGDGSARAEALHPSLALGLYCTEEAYRWRRLTTGHPAAAMGELA